MLRQRTRRHPRPQARPQRAQSASGPAHGILELQGLAGNAAVTGMLRTIMRDVANPEAALDDPNFNADSITHDLLRAIDQKDHTIVFKAGEFGGSMTEDPTQERRKVDFAKVVAVLEDRTASQIAEVERRYKAFEGRDLTFDLFEGGESNRQADLTADQRARIGLLLKGTRGEPIPTQVMAELKKYPPDVAQQIGAALIAKSNAAAAMQQLEADCIEVHELLWGEIDDTHRERLMALYRKPVKDITAMEAFYAQHFGMGVLDVTFTVRLSGAHRARLLALRRGDTAQADAYAIEEKRQAIAELSKQEDDDKYLELTSVGASLRAIRDKKKAELSGDIESILDMNRREALASQSSAGVSAGQAVADRINKILDQKVGESGATLGSDLGQTLPKEHASVVFAEADTWNTSGSGSLIEAAAAELVAMEKDHTTKATRIIETLQSFRKMAEHDLKAHVLDPTVSPDEKAKIGSDINSALTRLAQSYIAQYQAAYDRQRGDGRSYADIIKSASDADETYIGDLTNGGGRTSDLGELQHAMDGKDVEKVKEILRNQRSQQAIQSLVTAYNGLGEGRDLRKELFGHTIAGDILPLEMAESDDNKLGIVHGLVKGRDAEQIAEQLGKPEVKAQQPDGGGQPAPGMAADAEVDWIAKGGASEYSVTMGNRGWTGHIREIGGDPETERLLKDSNAHLAQLAAQFQAAKTPAEKQHLLIEIRKTRAALTGDADAYEKDNERVLGEIRGALSFAVSIALAIAIPGAGAGLAAFIETTALNIAANVAANMVIKGDDYTWGDLKGDVLGGVMGAAGGKFGEELLGRVAAKISSSAGKAAADVGEKVGFQTVLAKEISTVSVGGEKTVIAVEEFEVKEAGAAAANAGERGLLEKGAREVGSFVGGIYGGKVPSGDFGLSVDEVLKALVTTGVGKAAHHQSAGATEEHAPQEQEHRTTETHETEPDESTASQREEEAKAGGGAAGGSGGSGGGGGGGASEAAPGDAFGPRSPKQMLLENGLPPESASGFQQIADDLNIVIKVRPTNTASLQVLAEGGLPKAEIVKAKTLNRTDMLIGGPAGGEGKVGFFEPRMPPKEVLDVLNPDALKQVTDRYNQRLEEYNQHKAEYAQLAVEGLVHVENGVLQIADPRQAATPDAPHGPFKDVGGDHDVYDIRHADGSPLTEAERKLATALLRSMNINVEHGFHLAWEQDSPQTYSAEADAQIRQQHTDKDPLVAFVPKSQPQEVFADTEVHGPERKNGPGDRHNPLKGAQVVEPGPGSPGTDGPGHGPDETDFSGVAGHENAPGTPTRSANPVDSGGPDKTNYSEVLPKLNEPSAPLKDRLTYAMIESGAIHVEVIEKLPHLSGAELMKRGVDPRTHAVVQHPRLGELTIPLGRMGHEVTRGEILVSENMTAEEMLETIRHETNHALRPPSEAGSIQEYKDEFDAAWTDGRFDQFKPGQRAIEIRKHILETYTKLAEAATDPAFMAQVKAYRRPTGNTLNSPVWSNVEVEVSAAESGWELRVLEDIKAGSPEERRALNENKNFQELLEKHLSGVLLTEARRRLSAD